jgi:hypothetical protein
VGQAIVDQEPQCATEVSDRGSGVRAAGWVAFVLLAWRVAVSSKSWIEVVTG